MTDTIFFRIIAITGVLSVVCCQNGWAESTIVETGSCGTNCDYTIDSEGNLNITGTGSIKNNAFRDRTDITTVSIGEGITGMGNEVFYNASNLGNVSFPSSLSSIGWWAFGNTSLKELNIPDTVTYIDTRYLCGGCKDLESIYIPPVYGSYFGHTVITGTTKLKSFVLPDYVTGAEWGNWHDGTGATIYCTQEQISAGLCGDSAVRYEKKDGNFIVYNEDGSIKDIFAGYKDFSVTATVGFEEKTFEESNGNILSYNKNGEILSKYDSNGNLLSQYQYDDNGSAKIYDGTGNLIGFYGKGKLKIEDIIPVIKNKDNVVSITW